VLPPSNSRGDSEHAVEQLPPRSNASGDVTKCSSFVHFRKLFSGPPRPSPSRSTALPTAGEGLSAHPPRQDTFLPP
jgi:hypothetical protein